MIKIASYEDMHLQTLDDLHTLLEQAENNKDIYNMISTLLNANAPKELIRVLFKIYDLRMSQTDTDNEYYVSQDEDDQYYNSGCSEWEY